MRGGSRGAGVGASDSRQHLSSDRRTFVNLLISFVGAGILGIPFAYRQVGGWKLGFDLVGCWCGVVDEEGDAPFKYQQVRVDVLALIVIFAYVPTGWCCFAAVLLVSMVRGRWRWRWWCCCARFRQHRLRCDGVSIVNPCLRAGVSAPSPLHPPPPYLPAAGVAQPSCTPLRRGVFCCRPAC